jgi:hypothetical protein
LSISIFGQKGTINNPDESGLPLMGSALAYMDKNSQNLFEFMIKKDIMLQAIEEWQRKKKKTQNTNTEIIFYFWEGEEYEEDYVFCRLRYAADGWVGPGNGCTTS